MRRVIMVLRGGLGNQLFQLCAGETIQRQTGYPVFYDVELTFLSDPYHRRCEVGHLIPRSRRAPEHPGYSGWRSIVQEQIAIWLEMRTMWSRGVAALPPRALLRAIRWWPWPTIVCRGNFQLLEYLEIDTVRRIGDGMALSPSASVPEVAVHFRFGREQDGSGKSVDVFSGTTLRLDYYRAALDRVRRESGPIRFRVYTDSGGIPEEVFQSGDEVVLDQPSPGEKAWDVLSRMARSSHFIIANSTFSWWGAYLGQSADKRVYYPKHWPFVNGKPAQRGIFPEGWVGI